MAHVHGVAGNEAEARAILEELEHRSASEYVTPLAIAWVHLGLGDSDEAMNWFEKALEEGSGPFHLFLADPVYNCIRTTPRFRALLAKIGLERWAEPHRPG